MAPRTSTAATTVADVVVPAPFGRESWPLSGTISTHLVNSDGLDLAAVLAFNGTRYATLTVNGATVTVDLARPGLGGPGGPMGGPMGGPGGMRGPGGGMH